LDLVDPKFKEGDFVKILPKKYPICSDKFGRMENAVGKITLIRQMKHVRSHPCNPTTYEVHTLYGVQFNQESYIQFEEWEIEKTTEKEDEFLYHMQFASDKLLVDNE